MELVGSIAGPLNSGDVKAYGQQLLWASKEGIVLTKALKDSEEYGRCLTEWESWLYPLTEFVEVSCLSVSPCSKFFLIGGTVEDKNNPATESTRRCSQGLLLACEWDYITRSKESESVPHFIPLIYRHRIYSTEFSVYGDFMSVLSSVEASEEDGNFILSLWNWKPTSEMTSSGMGGSQTVAGKSPVLLNITEFNPLGCQFSQLRLSMTRGLPEDLISIMIVGKKSVWLNCMDQTGPLGIQLKRRTGFDFTLVAPDDITCAWYLGIGAFVVGVKSGYLWVGVNGEAKFKIERTRDNGDKLPCHRGTITDIFLMDANLYSLGFSLSSSRWRAGSASTESLQMLKEILVHEGPGSPVCLFPLISHSDVVWITYTNSGSIYMFNESTRRVTMVHDGPSEEVTCIEFARSLPLLVLTTRLKWVYVFSALQNNEVKLESAASNMGIKMFQCLCRINLEVMPTIASFTVCQVTQEELIVIIGAENGTLRLCYLHTTNKPREPFYSQMDTDIPQLTVVQFEKPHEMAITKICCSYSEKGMNRNDTAYMATLGEDNRLFVFKLLEAKRVTKFEPQGFFVLVTIPETLTIASGNLIIEERTGVHLKINLKSCRQKTASSTWQLERKLEKLELAPGGDFIMKSALDEIRAYLASNIPKEIIIACITFESSSRTALGLTSTGRLVYIQGSTDASGHAQTFSYSIEVFSPLLRPIKRISIDKTSIVLMSDRRSKLEDQKPQLRSPSGTLAKEQHQLSPKDYLKTKSDLEQHSTIQKNQKSFRKPGGKDDPLVVKGQLAVSPKGQWVCCWLFSKVVKLYKLKSFCGEQCLDVKLKFMALREISPATTAALTSSLEQRMQRFGMERQRASMEERVSLIQQRLSKLKWDYKQLETKYEERFGKDGTKLELIFPLHPTISEYLNRQSLNAINQIMKESDGEMEVLEVLVGKLRTLFSWNPLMQIMTIKAVSSGNELSTVDFSEELKILLAQLPKLWRVLFLWSSGMNQKPFDPTINAILQKNYPNNSTVGRPPSVGTKRKTSDAAQNSKVAISQSVRDLVTRVRSLHPTRKPGEDNQGERMAEADLDPGRQMKWRKKTLNRVANFRRKEEERKAQLSAMSRGSSAKGKVQKEKEGTETEKEEEDIELPPFGVTVQKVEEKIWNYLYKIDEKCSDIKKEVDKMAEIQTAFLKEMNENRYEWGGQPPLTLPYLPFFDETKGVTDSLVNEFYIEAFEIKESLRAEESEREETERSSIKKADKRSQLTQEITERRLSLQHADVPRLSLHSDPAARKISDSEKRKDEKLYSPSSEDLKSGETTRSSFSSEPTKRRTDKMAMRDCLSSPTSAQLRPFLTLDQVQAIQRKKIQFLGSLEEINKSLHGKAFSVDDAIALCERKTEAEKMCLAWACQCLGGVIHEAKVKSKYVQQENELREALKERIKERDEVRNRLHEIKIRIREIEKDEKHFQKLEEDLSESFASLVSDNAQFEVQLTKVFESGQGAVGTNLNSDDSSGPEDVPDAQGDGWVDLGHEEDEDQDSSDADSGIGAAEASAPERGPSGRHRRRARMGEEDTYRKRNKGGCPQGCDPAVFKTVLSLRDLRWRVKAYQDQCSREKLTEDRRLAGIQRRLHRATSYAIEAKKELSSMQERMESEVGNINVVVWLKKSQISNRICVQDLASLPRFRERSGDTGDDFRYSFVQKGFVEKKDTPQQLPILVSDEYMSRLQQNVTSLQKAREESEKQAKIGKSEKKTLMKEIQDLREQLVQFQKLCDEVKKSKGLVQDLSEVAAKLEAGLDSRWIEKIIGQEVRHKKSLKHHKEEERREKMELRALQKEESALSSHLLALRRERDHMIHLLQDEQKREEKLKRENDLLGKGTSRWQEEIEELKGTLSKQEATIKTLRREVAFLRHKPVTIQKTSLPPIQATEPASPPVEGDEGYSPLMTERTNVSEDERPARGEIFFKCISVDEEERDFKDHTSSSEERFA